MEALLSFRHPIVTYNVSPSPLCTPRSVVRAAKSMGQDQDDDPLFRAAIKRASLRFQETLRPDPLFVDPYVGCCVPSSIEEGSKLQCHPHCVAVKFIDEKLLSAISNFGVKQVVLLTDGADTRPYRLNWPRSTIIFDISPERVFKRVNKSFEGVPNSKCNVHIGGKSEN